MALRECIWPCRLEIGDTAAIQQIGNLRYEGLAMTPNSKVQSPIERNQKSGVHSHGVFKAKLKNKVPITPDFPLEKRCFQMVYQQLG
jgi:hypothetical protein